MSEVDTKAEIGVTSESVNVTVSDPHHEEKKIVKSGSIDQSKKFETTNPDERKGLTTDEVDKLYEKWGFNELPVIEIPLWKVFIQQFMGTMPYMLEICIIISAACQDWADFGIIIAMLGCNGTLGFMEELKAAKALAELTNQMEKKIATVRDGQATQLLTRLLVPGDVVLLVGGCEVPADIEWLEGDTLSIDTAALTGEPLPRKYPSDQYGKLILCGATVKAGEAYGIVRATGTNTEIGGSQAEILKDKATTKVSLFEQRILNVVKVVILISLIDVIIIFFVQGFARGQFDAGNVSETLLTCLSIIIASVPIALPLVLQVTMALGAAKMATEYHCVVTSLPALQDISSMSVLCSDKTGTLTTAKISIHADSVWLANNFTKEDLALYASLASSRDKKEDAIDRSVIGYVDKTFGQEQAMKMEAEYTKIRGVGFNPIYKRVLFEYSHPTKGKISVSKGLPNKVLDTADGGEDDADDQWKCDRWQELKKVVAKTDYDFSKAGYKTLGIVVKLGDGPWQYCGILPMLDPPRHDSAQTIKNLNNAGIEVKMCTGDHLNIAIETARLIGLGVNMHAGSEIRDGSHSADELIKESNGFAQVLPKDKREVVLTLRDKYKMIVGMTGDGVNDAPALSAAQCGVAVDDATDAAKNAAAIILTSPGLSAIYAAVVESRRIFRKLKSYATYRIAASIQIVIVLTLLIYISNCSINSFFIVLLALFNDITMLPIAYDIQVASKMPEDPNIIRLLIMSTAMGVMGTAWTLLFSYVNQYTGWFTYTYVLKAVGQSDWVACTTETQAIIWLQMFIATELLIFSARAASYMLFSVRPSISLIVSVLIGIFIFCMLAGQSSEFGSISATDILLVLAWDIVTLFVTDIVKVHILRHYFEESTDILADIDIDMSHPEEITESKSVDIEQGGAAATGSSAAIAGSVARKTSAQKIIFEEEDPANKKENAEVARMDTFLRKSGLTTAIRMEPGSGGVAIDAGRRKSSAAIILEKRQSGANFIQPIAPAKTSAADVRRNSLARGPLLPNTPGSLATLKKK